MCKEEDDLITRKTYILLNSENTVSEITKLNDGTEAELINIDNFIIKEVPINNIETGQWFVFVEPTEVNDVPCVSVNNGIFIYLCIKNNKNGSIEAKTTHLDFEKKIEVIGKINNMIKEKLN